MLDSTAFKAVPLLFEGFQLWKLHTPGDYAGFFAILLAGSAVLWAATQHLKKNRTRERALARTAAKLRKLGGPGAEVYTDRTIRCGTESVPSELVMVSADRVYVGKVFHFGLKVTGGANMREWLLKGGTELRKEENPVPAMREQRALLLKVFAKEKLKDIPVEFLIVFADCYGRTTFRVDGIQNAVDYRDLKSWWKKRPARFSGRIDMAEVKKVLDRTLS